jgi:hypothetical protein
MSQDSSDPTGVSTDGTGRPSALVRARERKAASALQMRLAEATWEEICEVVGYPTPRLARVAVERALEAELRGDEDSKEKMRKIAGMKLDRLLRSVWVKAVDPNNPEHLQAVAKARELIDRHAKLYGLDAPTEVVVHSPTANELEQWVAAVVGVGPKVEEFDIFEGEVIETATDGYDGSDGSEPEA